MVLGSSPAQFFGAAGAAASGGGDAYVVTKSLRFSSSDTAYLDRTVSIYSNQQQWTWSGWVKRAKLGTEQVIFTAGASTAGTRWSALRFQTDDSLSFINNGGGSTDINLVTSRLFRDPSAWYHIVVRANIQDEVSGNRISIYVNGEKETVFSVNTQPSASTSTGINYNQIHNIGREAARSTYYCDLYLAEINFVDGLALTADNFGRTNSTTGSWEPIDFSSAPNNGTTWSDYLTTDDGSFDASYPKTNAFNGNQTNRAICNTAVGGTSYIQFNSPTPLSGTLRVRCDNNNEVYNVSGGSSTLLGQNTSGSDNSFVDCGEVTGLTSLKILMVSGSRAGVSAIEVGGVILIDNFNKFTNGTFYSNFASGVANLQRMFDNDSGTWANVAAGDTVTFEPGTAIACTQLELWVDTTTPIRVDVNGGGYGSTFTTSGLQYIDITPGGGISSLTSLLIDAPSGGGGSGAGVRGIRINGTTVLQDATIGRNSFSLKFTDSSSDSALGKDSFNGNNWNVNNISAGASVYFVNNAGTSLDSYIPAGFTNTQNTNSLFTNDNNGVIVSAPTGGNWLRMKATSSTATVKWMTYDGGSGGPTITLSVNLDGSGGYITPSVTGAGSSADPKIGTFSVSSGTSYYIRTNLTGSLNTSMVLYVTGLEGDEASGQDSLFDSPTNANAASDTGAGGEVSGNYCTLNPINANLASTTLSEGNLKWVKTSASNVAIAYGTIGVNSGKYYYEATVNSYSAYFNIGWNNGSGGPSADSDTNSAVYSLDSGIIRRTVNATSTVVASSKATSAGVIGMAIDCDNNTVSFYHNNSLQHTVTGMAADTYFPRIYVDGTSNASDVDFNFGQRPFAYTAPTGYQPLTTALLDDPTIVKGSSAMDVALWTGNGFPTSNTQPISGLGFSPDLVWIKARSNTDHHGLFNTVTGETKWLASNLPNSEITTANSLTSFDSNGFTLGNYENFNYQNTTYVGWTWNAGGQPTTDNVAGAGNVPTAGSVKINGADSTTALAGSIPATRLSANTSAGFSIVEYTGGSGEISVGHGLGVAPEFIICRPINNTSPWAIYHSAIGKDGGLNFSTGGAFSISNYWGTSGVTSSVFGAQEGNINNNGASYTHIAYCFAPVEGYSAISSYTSSTSSNKFVYLGFRPKFLMCKKVVNSADSAYESWIMFDSERGSYNLNQATLYANRNYIEGKRGQDGTAHSTFGVDFLSNGFAFKDNSTEYNRADATQYIYYAVAENPFKYARAR